MFKKIYASFFTLVGRVLGCRALLTTIHVNINDEGLTVRPYKYEMSIN